MSTTARRRSTPSDPTLASEIATGIGKSVGVVSTARLTDAAPAAVCSRTADRDWENDSFLPERRAQLDIAAQLAERVRAGVLDLAPGREHENVPPAESTGGEGNPGAHRRARPRRGARRARPPVRLERRDLCGAACRQRRVPIDRFEDSHTIDEHDRTGEPSLAEMAEPAINTLSQNSNGCFISIEGGRVDRADHAGNSFCTVTDGVAFAQAVETTSEEDTLIIVRADHSHTLDVQGICGRGTPITGLWMEADPAGEAHTGVATLASGGKADTVAGDLNGPGSVLVEQSDASFSGTGPTLTQEEMADPDFLQRALVPLPSKSHSGGDVYPAVPSPTS